VIEWADLSFPPINLWNLPRTKEENERSSHEDTARLLQQDEREEIDVELYQQFNISSH